MLFFLQYLEYTVYDYILMIFNEHKYKKCHGGKTVLIS